MPPGRDGIALSSAWPEALWEEVGMFRDIIHRGSAALLALPVAVGIGLLSLDAAAQDMAQAFRGKQIRLLIGSSAGGGYDLFARTIAAHWPRHIPGNPSFVPQNVPGAFSLQVANNVFALAPKDGTVIGAVNPQIVSRAILDPATARFDARQFTWIGSALREYQVMVARTDAPVKTFADAFKTELIVGGSGGATDTFPVISNAVLGTKFRVISGYPGTREVNLALDRGEVQGNGAITWASIKSTMTAMLAEKRINLIVQFGLKDHAELPQVPNALRHATTAEQRDALMLLFATQEFGRPFIGPPDLPAPIAAVLRQSFMATMKDPVFLEEARRRGLDIDPTPSEEILALVRALYETPSGTVQRVRDIFSIQK
jgi:tripartite-type tricarboxylate transporter receptor subunit TctC